MRSELLRSETGGERRWDEAQEENDAGGVTFLMFQLGSRTYATDVCHVREIVDITEIQPLPNAPHDVLGMIDLRRQSIPVIDLAVRMQVAAEPEKDARILVFEFGDARTAKLLGIVADRVLGVREVTPDMIESLEHAQSGWRNDGVLGVIRNEETQCLVLRIEHFLAISGMPGEFDFE